MHFRLSGADDLGDEEAFVKAVRAQRQASFERGGKGGQGVGSFELDGCYLEAPGTAAFGKRLEHDVLVFAGEHRAR